MKKISLIIVSMFLLVQTLQASWIYISPQERVSRTDMIVVVELMGQSGTVDKGEVFMGRGQQGTYMRKDTVWEVKVHQVIKGLHIGEKLHILTSGVRDNKVQMSTDFYLDDEMEKYALLFLNESKEGYYIKTPMDIAPLKEIVEGELEDTLQEENLLNQTFISEQDKEDWDIYKQLLLELEKENQDKILEIYYN